MKTQKAPLTGGVDLALDYRTMLKGVDWKTRMQIMMHNLALAYPSLQQPKNSGLNDLCQRIGAAIVAHNNATRKSHCSFKETDDLKHQVDMAIVAVKTALAQKEETQKKANIILRALGESGILAMIQEKRYGKR